MRLMERARAAIEGRLRRIEDALRRIDGVRVQRLGDDLTVRAPRRRWIEDVRLRFLERGR